MVRCHDLHGIEILLLVQKFAIVGISGTAGASIKRIDQVLANIAAARDDAFSARAPVRLIQSAPYIPEQGIARPVAIAAWILAGVANRDYPDFGRSQHRHQL